MNDHRQALPNGMCLLNDYRIDGLLGEGGFGVTYLAIDLALKARVAIKEYFPRPHAYREQDTVTISASNGEEGNFQWGLQRFREEAQTLAGFQHPNIVGVKRVFDANNTAYAVLNFEDGKSFNRWLRELGRPPSQQELDRIVLSLLEALQLVHSNGLLHRDISPDNIIVRQDSTPVLIDFGSARRAMTGEENMSAVVKAGYSPLEQYSTVASDQGPWSDIYSLGGTLYFAVTGKAPPPSPDRILNETYISAAEAARGSFRKEFLDAIDSCLKIRASDRPQNMSDLRALLNIETFPATGEHTIVIRAPIETQRRRFPIIGAVLGLAVLVAFGAYNFADLKKLAGFEEKPTVIGPGASAMTQGSPIIPGHFSHSVRVEPMKIGSVSETSYNGHMLSHKVLGKRHRSLEGHRFRGPGQHLYDRLAKLRGHLWHTRFKHVVIVGPGGAIACDLYCDFDVPLNVYGDFVAAVGEAQAEDAGKGASPEELQRQRLATEHGWNKAVAILEEAAAEDDKKAAETKGGPASEAVPDEQVDVALEGGEAKKG